MEELLGKRSLDVKQDIKEEINKLDKRVSKKISALKEQQTILSQK